MAARNTTRVAFIVGAFPLRTETFIINQVADLLDRGLHVEVFSLKRGDTTAIASRYYDYRMASLTHYLNQPAHYLMMILVAMGKITEMAIRQPSLLRVLFSADLGNGLHRSQLAFLLAPFAGRRFDLIHCHFGPAAKEYLRFRRHAGHTQPVLVTFYGYDVSALLRQHGDKFYDDVRSECASFFVMSQDMKRRVVEAGFPESKVVVLPVSIDVEAYPYAERERDVARPVQILSVGRFVEKKGFDDIVRALTIVRRSTNVPFRVSFVGGGLLEAELRSLVHQEGLDEVVTFKGYLSNEDVQREMMRSDLFVQPSKTAADGDME